MPSSAWGVGRTAASNRITIGVIGWGMMGPANTKAFLTCDDCQVVAACDIHTGHLQTAVDTVNAKYGNTDCKAYHDYRELMARDDIDAVMIAVPDHWHAMLATYAASRKKDIYGEKPLAKTIAEQQAIVRAVAEKQHHLADRLMAAVSAHLPQGCGDRPQRPHRQCRRASRSACPARLTTFPTPCPRCSPSCHRCPTRSPIPPKLCPAHPPGTSPSRSRRRSSTTRIGSARRRWSPTSKQRVYQNWRWNYNTGGGQLLDWIGHHGDIAHWGLGFDLTGPSEIDGRGEFPPANAVWNAATKYKIECKYRKEVTHYPVDVGITIAGGYPEIAMGTKWIGTDGWVWVDRGGFDASNPDWVNGDPLPEDLRKIKLYESAEHRRNFIDCVKSRKPTITPVETAHHSTLPGHLGLISMLVGRKLQWDVAQEKILNDPAASQLMTRPFRAPYKLT